MDLLLRSRSKTRRYVYATCLFDSMEATFVKCIARVQGLSLFNEFITFFVYGYATKL